MRWSWLLTARSTLALASLEFGAVSMRFSAADAMFVSMCMCSGDEEVSPDLRFEMVRSAWLVYLWQSFVRKTDLNHMQAIAVVFQLGVNKDTCLQISHIAACKQDMCKIGRHLHLHCSRTPVPKIWAYERTLCPLRYCTVSSL